jgi:hypothetical protein
MKMFGLVDSKGLLCLSLYNEKLDGVYKIFIGYWLN